MKPGPVRTVPLGKIVATESPFRLTPLENRPSEILLESIRRVGLLTPLWVKPAGPRYVLVAGFRRYAAARTLRFRTVPAIAFSNRSDAELLRWAAHDNAGARQLTLLEKLAQVRALRAFGVPQAELVKSDFPRLGFPPLPRFIDTLKKMETLGDGLLSYLSEKDAPLRRLTSFFGLDRPAADLLARLAQSFRPGLNDLEAFARCLIETASRDGEKPSQLLREIERAIPPQSPDRPSHETFSLFAAELFRRRFPTLSLHREKAARLLRRLRLPDFVKLNWDPSFERPGVSLRAEIQNPQQWQELLRRLNRPGTAETFRRLLKLTDP
ncbi:MAG TPA: ParB N-terminal domain-containing protein [Elusimicrobiota bacterium]|nr:ParB N-terminal domain-containing protein [Elusimicrobiota bacterium]